ncbi:hypothetical protein WOLCODRAFT_135609 [Wolfiporia cocos MD-104 SS10]|uniref:Uncharacterized protein n=1 Tax=Wolfiporia cocos (strain MD-104) TaxID=742152 RepID=A0A2H3IWC6_WOLCO|nr:hypothetical protein WOLCODRAFT_135609 [Wolfiporia cocos MD-104 SS10]
MVNFTSTRNSYEVRDLNGSRRNHTHRAETRRAFCRIIYITRRDWKRALTILQNPENPVEWNDAGT